MLSHVPRSHPCLFNASMAYSEHDGVYRHVLNGSSGESNSL